MDDEESFEPDYLEDDVKCEQIPLSVNFENAEDSKKNNSIINSDLNLQASSICDNELHDTDIKQSCDKNVGDIKVVNEVGNVTKDDESEDSSDDNSNSQLEGDGSLCEDLLARSDDDDDGEDEHDISGPEKLSDEKKFVIYSDVNDMFNPETEIISLDVTEEEVLLLDTFVNNPECESDKKIEDDKIFFAMFENEMKPFMQIAPGLKELAKQQKYEKILRCLDCYCQKRKDVFDTLCNTTASLLDDPATCYRILVEQISGGLCSSCIKNCLPVIGARLVLNCCLNNKSLVGLTILKIMLNEKIYFHNVNSKFFTIPNVIKAVIEACFNQKKYGLIIQMVKSFDYFSCLPSSKVKDNPFPVLSYQQLLNLNVVFQYASHHIMSVNSLDDQPTEFYSLVTLCLDVLQLFLESKCSNFSSRCWLLVKASLAGNMFVNIRKIFELCLSHKGLINWNLVQYQNVISFLLNYYLKHADFYDCSIMLLELLYKDGVIHKFQEFNLKDEEHVVSINKGASEKEIIFTLTVYIESIIRQFFCLKSVEQAKWTVILHDSVDGSSQNLDGDVKCLEKVLSKSFSYLSWEKFNNSYLIKSMSSSEKFSHDSKKYQSCSKNTKAVQPHLDLYFSKHPVDKVERTFSSSASMPFGSNQNSKDTLVANEFPFNSCSATAFHNAKHLMPSCSTTPLPVHPRFKNTVRSPPQETVLFKCHPRFQSSQNC
ncbi:hypothetical protein HELRODRAFT_167799 [Helobdella robusta]|uniref:Uncharacterized protein n=1 Tax=Helobdella robusta TaxID=6412 RepID=T1EZT8_HELRO|nr:hypothetical protein HELRODRAFT_167799 [Helobdella robusta]ESO09967.1 hypothetical protein HELRODRAFT_167799 [Helobdella robusta]